ncbi:class B sortase [Clostridia bacterium OttesenSCG-928-F22]|nr:class B sortase [Clostridia bacterium OttesenSCG-928-F22]
MKTKFLMAGAILCLCAVLFGGYMLYRHYMDEQQYTEEFENLAAVVQQAKDDKEQTSADVPLAEDETILSEYDALYLQNQDFVGWLRIDGTTINYPVMQTPDRPDYYLKRNFEGKPSNHGVPYVSEGCDVLAPSDNIIIYGHHIKGGKMFGALMDYTKKDFYEQHKIIRFDTLMEYGEYEIVAVFRTVAYSENGFPFFRFINAENTEDFDAYIAECKRLSYYDTGVTAEYGDKLITLSTCEYSAQNGRLVIVAKKITEGGS